MSLDTAASILRPGAAEAFEAYTRLVLANREQIERLRDQPEPEGDFWARRAPRFRPGVLEAEELPGLIELARPDDVWLDIGAGGGRFALPLSAHVGSLIAVEPSPAMRGVIAEAIAAESRANIEVVDLRWPPPQGAEAPTGDVSLVANVLYDNLELEAFLAALESHSRRLCIVICSDHAPSSPDPALWEALHGEPIHMLPGLPELLAVLGALHRKFEVRAFGMARSSEPMAVDDAMNERWRYWVEPGSSKDTRLRELLLERFGTASGEVVLPPRRNWSSVVSWEPPVS